MAHGCFLLLCLSLTSFVLALGKIDPRSDPKLNLLVSDLPGLHSNIDEKDIPRMYSGQVELYPQNNTRYYFWKHQDTHKVDRNHKRTTFWFNGGPGCSSMDGALMELGPFRINSDKEVTYNEGSWHRLSDMVYVDQPGGTGFSTTDKIDHELNQVARDFMRFLEKYFELFPEDIANDIYLAGESYAGQYIPYIAASILDHNAKSNSTYNLKGLLIGNGWISPNEQSMLYLQFAVEAGLISKDNAAMPKILQQQEECQKIVSKIDAAVEADKVPSWHDFESDSTACEAILNMITRATTNLNGPKHDQCINIYDYRLRDESPACGMTWPPDLANVYKFLRETQVLTDLHVTTNKQWTECSHEVGRDLKARDSMISIHLFLRILESVPIMLFHGDRDLICNTVGALNMIKKLKWGGHTGFSKNAPQIPWVHGNQSAGYIKSERNLTFVSVYNASHMVPFDKPDVLRALLDLMTHHFDADTSNGAVKYVTHPLERRGAGTGPGSSTNPSTTSSVTRIIQFAVILVLLWGLHVLYSAYRARPSSIIKSSTGNTSASNGQRKKNVQWAENLRRFQLEEQLMHQNTSFLSKALQKFRGTERRGNYTPPRSFSPDLRQSFELDSLASHAIDDDFIIGSDDELDEETRPQDPLL